MQIAAAKRVFWFGAGISIASGLPDGGSLTKHWLEHHLPSGELEPLLKLYEHTFDWTEKTFPRLEKVIDDTIWAMGSECLANLEIFRNCPPNWVHRTIAADLIDGRGWAVTTNFDEAVETAAGWAVSVVTPAATALTGGGLIKLHGSIAEDWQGLGHSIRNLEAGLVPPLRAKLLELLDDPDRLFVFVGYSGSDSFDVTPLFAERSRKEEPFAARAVWLHWVADANAAAAITQDELFDNLPQGARTMLSAFQEDRRMIVAGPSEHTLPQVLTCTPDTPPAGASPDWRQGWAQRFAPTPDMRRRFAAKLYASLGMGAEALRFTDIDRVRADHVYGIGARLLLNALRDQGLYQSEYLLRRRLAAPTDAVERADWERKGAACLRLSGRHVRAAFAYLRFLARPRAADAGLRREQLWSFAESGIFFHSACMAVTSRPLLRRLLAPLVMTLRLMVAMALSRLDAGHNAPEVSDPHLREAVVRLSSFLCDPMGGIVEWAENLYFRNRPVLDFHDERSNGYVETDSLLGIVNQRRVAALALLNQIEWDLHQPRATPETASWLATIEWHLRSSLYLARHIGDPVGEAKAAAHLARIAGWRGLRRMASGWRRYARQCSARTKEADHRATSRLLSRRGKK